MATLDVVIAVVITLFILNGIRKGFFREILGLAGIILGFFMGIVGAGPLSGWLAKQFPSLPSVIIPLLSFLALFLGVYFGSKMLARSLSVLMEKLKLSWLNRILGGAVSGLKGILLLSLIFWGVSLLPFKGTLNSAISRSRFFPAVKSFVPTFYNMGSGFSPSSHNFEKRVNEILRKSRVKLKKETLKFLLQEHSDSAATR